MSTLPGFRKRLTELAERQVTNVLQVANQIPGIVITMSTGSSNSARIVLRGAGQEQGGINFDPAVGIYSDNVYQPRINGAKGSSVGIRPPCSRFRTGVAMKLLASKSASTGRS